MVGSGDDGSSEQARSDMDLELSASRNTLSSSGGKDCLTEVLLESVLLATADGRNNTRKSFMVKPPSSSRVSLPANSLAAAHHNNNNLNNPLTSVSASLSSSGHIKEMVDTAIPTRNSRSSSVGEMEIEVSASLHPNYRGFIHETVAPSSTSVGSSSSIDQDDDELIEGDKFMKSASFVMRESFLGFGMGPLHIVEAVDTPTRIDRPRSDSVKSIKSIASNRSAGPLLIQGAVNGRGYYLSLPLRLKMAYECCLGIAFLHSRGMMHCDIKSLNFLVAKDFGIRLADLGEARRSDDVAFGDALPRLELL
jgi:hypothetical protein